jgi:hypothetical protein
MSFCKSLTPLYNDLSVNKSRPAVLNSIVGLIATLANVYTIQGGHWSVTAIVTAAVIAYLTLFAMILYMTYMGWTEAAWKEHCAMNGHHVPQ